MRVSSQQLRNAVLTWGTRALECHAQDCSGPRRVWQRMSSHSRSICVHGLRYCFPQCFERELHQRFEHLHFEQAAERRRERRVPLGLLMLSRADVTAAQLRHALAEQVSSPGMRIGECLRRLGYVDQQQVTAALAAQYRCPILHTMPQQVPQCGLPYALLSRFQMLPVHFVSTTRTLHIAFASEVAFRALVAAEQMLDSRTEACLTTPAELQAGFERMQQHAGASEKQFAGPRTSAEMARITSSYAARLEAENVKLAACGELAWVRIESGSNFMNLIFSGQAETVHGV